MFAGCAVESSAEGAGLALSADVESAWRANTTAAVLDHVEPSAIDRDTRNTNALMSS